MTKRNAGRREGAQAIRLRLGDSFELLKDFPEESVEAVVTDPPYGLSFMNREWDDLEASHQMQLWHEGWLRECLRILKPGGVIKAFSATRTFHRLAAAMESVGFTLRPNHSTEAWVHGQGFPKNLNVSKALDKKAGVQRKVVGERNQRFGLTQAAGWNQTSTPRNSTVQDTAAASPEAKRFEGYGTALKPSWEPFLVGYKDKSPEAGPPPPQRPMPDDLADYLRTLISPPGEPVSVALRDLDWDEVAQWEDSSIPGLIIEGTPTPGQAAELMRVLRPGAHLLIVAPEEEPTAHTAACIAEDAGFEARDSILWVREAGRFHYVPKVARAERESGYWRGDALTKERRNTHPTLKPVDLMVRLLQDVPQGLVVDPFMGSGSTGMACIRTGHDFCGIEKEEEYLESADSRAQHEISLHPMKDIEFESDFEEPEPEEQDLFDILDGGGE